MKKNGFTLMEVLVTVTLVSLLAAFALTNYNKAIEKNNARQAVLNLKTIYQACQISKARDGIYCASLISESVSINEACDINIEEGNYTYSYNGADPSSFVQAAAADHSYRITLNQPIIAGNPASIGAVPYTP